MSETFSGKGYGALPNIDSIRVYSYENLPKSENIISKSSDVTDYKIPQDIIPKVKDQGMVNSCVANACCSVLETFYYLETGKKIELSPGWFYGFNRGDNDKYEGMITGNAIERTRKHGSVSTTVFNDHTEMPVMQKIVKERNDLEKYAEDTRIKSFVTFNRADRDRRWEEVKEAFLTYNLPMVAVSNSYFGGSHCIMVYGFNENGRNGRELYYQNSWGENFGDEGRSSIPFSSVNYIYLLLDEEITLNFNDVPEDAWYYKNVLHMYSAGLIKGRDNNNFEPDAPITRAEVCAIVDRLMERIEEKDDAMMKSIYNYVDRHDEVLRG